MAKLENDRSRFNEHINKFFASKILSEDKIDNEFVDQFCAEIVNLSAKWQEDNKIDNNLVQKYISEIRSHFENIANEYNAKLSAEVQQVCNRLEEDTKNIPKLMKDYLSQLDLTYYEVIRYIKCSALKFKDNQFQSDEKQEIDFSFPLEVQKYVFVAAVDKCSVTKFVSSMREISCQLGPLKNVVLDKIRDYTNALDNYRDEFTALRNAMIPDVLLCLNKLRAEDRIKEYAKIAHNGLYMNDFAYDDHY